MDMHASFLVTSFKSTQNLKDPSCFFAKTIGDDHEPLLCSIMPCCITYLSPSFELHFSGDRVADELVDK